MSQYLAEHLQTVCVPEYARYYCKNLNNKYTLQDELNMYYGQLALEEALVPLAKNNLLICDTTFLTVKVWCDHLFGDTPTEVKESIINSQYDLYLLMDIDLPWENDPLRDFPEQRTHFMQVWTNELEKLQATYRTVNGSGLERLQKGLELVKDFIQQERETE